MINYTCCNSPIGEILLAEKGGYLVGAYIMGQKYFPDITHGYQRDDNNPILLLAKDWLCRYFKGGNPKIAELPLKPKGTDFQRMVWSFLCGIPYGTTISYGEIAEKISSLQGKKATSARAVGNAIGRNPVLVIIPCHRVIGKNGDLTGYAGGLDKKVFLLRLEGII